jgi:serine/threonine protein kinase
MAAIHHPACLSLIAFGMPADGRWCFVTKKMDCDLRQVLDQEEKGTAPSGWNETAKSIVALGIAAGLSYLHSQNIIHRDVNPENILLDSTFYPRIGGFTFAKVLPPGEPSKMTMGVGTPLFMAPELHMGAEDYGYPVDVFAYGLLLYWLVTGERPFPMRLSPIRISQQVVEGDRPAIPPYVNAFYTGLIQSCWKGDTAQRPTFADISSRSADFMLDGCDEAAFEHYRCDVLKLTG